MGYKMVCIFLCLGLLLSGCRAEDNTQIINDYESQISSLEAENESLALKLKEQTDINSALANDLDELKNEIEPFDEEDNVIDNSEHRVVDYSRGFIRFVEDYELNDTYTSLSIVGYNSEFYDGPIDVLDLSGEHMASIKFKIHGSLYNFKIQYIMWNDDATEYEITEDVCNISEVRNTDVLFNSLLPEGLPSEMLSWENEKGEVFSYLIGDDGYGFVNKVLLCDEYGQK